MNNYILVSFFSFICLFVPPCFAGKVLEPIKMENQEEIFFQGQSSLLSNKTTSILLRQKNRKIHNQKGCFYMECFNHADVPVNLHFRSLKVTDQRGRPVRVVPKEEHMRKRQREKNWNLFFSGFSEVVDSLNADQAGKIEYHERTEEKFNSDYKKLSSHGFEKNSLHERGVKQRDGVIYSEALRREELRRIREEAADRNAAICNRTYEAQDRLQNFYFDSNTIYPHTFYASDFQIEVPRHIERDLQTLIVTFNVEGETHSFFFSCEKNR